MGRKVFISILGTGFYGKCSYVSDGFKSSPTRFVQFATLEYLKQTKQWGNKEDKAFIFLTNSARTSNWDKTIATRTNRISQQEEEYIGLEAELGEWIPAAQFEGVSIKDGRDNQEMWEVFNSIFSKIEKGDELYFDLTHGFRYLPMFLLVLGNYSKFLNKTIVAGITYGNYEARDKATGDAPLMDLMPLVQLQDWTYAAANFVNNGDTQKLTDLCKGQVTPMLIATAGKNKEANSIKVFANRLQTFIDDMQFCRGGELKKQDNALLLQKAMENVNRDIIPALSPVIKEIKNTIDNLVSNNCLIDLFNIAERCYLNRQYQAAVTILDEAVITAFCSHFGLKDTNKTDREVITSAIAIAMGREGIRPLPEEKWNASVTDHEQMKKMLQDELLQDELFVNDLCILTSIRNDFNHAGFLDNARSIDTLKGSANKSSEIEECLCSIRAFIITNADKFKS
jgi:CRISPR-associated Csx2 family protein